MTKIRIDQLIWESWNEIHVKKHGVSRADVERGISHVRAFKYGYRGRIVLICKIGDKFVSVILDKKSEGKYYVVTARVASRKERRIGNEKDK